ncbi:hypothetical protein Fmac_003365 [Flemingia macrophylla]|uniref:Uncharacterized protein n=1 Tax=Flemingia macrophylla TaxID=520843 RepID=A0ABD1NMJ6_9FABA
MAEAVLEIVLENLISFIQKELGQILGFDQEMKNMKNLSSLFTATKATLEDAAEKQFSDKSVKDWLQKLKDAAHSLDDILDECAYEALGLEYHGVKCGLLGKVRRSCLSSFHHKHIAFRYKIAKKMKLIFNHERVVSHFEKTIWVCVSEDFGLKRTIKAIIEAVTGSASGNLDLEILQRKLQNLLQRKRYLLVLDDVWDDKQENWQRLKSVLSCKAKGASVLVTTRLPTVASIMGTKPPHELSMLSEIDCWELFKQRAFGPNEVIQEELVIIGKEIVRKCGGVPLAAKSLGGLLRFKREKKEWFYVKESNLWNLPQDENSIIPALRLSYLNLPIKQRQCFAFCAIFPKDERIEKQYLIELWMANGFISSNEILDAEDVGDGVWHELYWRSFFQEIKTDEFGRVISFKMHDLAQFAAEGVCCITNDNHVTTLSERIFHLSDYRFSWKSYDEIIQLHQVKSLRTCIDCYRIGQLSAHVFKCYSLRVLHYQPTGELSSSIGDLKHLRYLNLSRGWFKTLPESLCNLWNLQILKLDGCKRLQKLPNNLIRLKYIQQLSLDGCSSLSSLPPQIGKLTSLRILNVYFVGKEKGFNLEELGPLKLKGDLCITRLEKVQSVMDAKKAKMSSKQLNMLWLSWGTNEESELQENVEQILEELQPDIQQLHSLSLFRYKGSYFPQWISSSSIKELQILECHKFNVSAGFQYLKDLKIDGCKEVDGLHEALQHMTALKSLYLHNLPNLDSLPDCFENLPLLCNFEINNRPKLTCLPVSLSLSTLKNFTIWGCPELEKRCQKETGEDWQKITHVPNVEVISMTLGEFDDSCAEFLRLRSAI